MIRIKAERHGWTHGSRMEDPDRFCISKIPGADPKTLHPIQRIGRGVGNIALFVVEATAALLELFWPPRSEAASEEEPPAPRRRRRHHPVEKSTPFPIND